MARGPDILQRTAPSLSATTDEPLADIPEPPISASNNAADQAAGAAAEMSAEDQAAARRARQDGTPQTEARPDSTQAEGEEKPGEEKPSSEGEPEGEEGGERETPPWALRQITRARKAQADARKAADEAAAKLAEAERQRTEIEAELARLRASQTERPDPRPTREQFDSPDAYDTALAEWGRREGAREAARHAEDQAEIARKQADEAAAREKQEADQKARDADVAKLNVEWATKRQAAIEKYPDFVAVTESDDALHISPLMAHAIMRAPNGADVAYYLAKNPEEAARITDLTNAGDQIYEMGRLAERIERQGRRTSAAPRPMQPIGTGNNSAGTEEREPSMEEWAARRMPELQSQRQPFFNTGPRRPATH